MNQDHKWSKSFLFGALAIILVIGLLLTLFIVQKPQQERETIVLPSVPAAPTPPAATESPQNDPFVQVTPDNVLSLLRTMNRPSAYHQIYTVQIGGDEANSARTVELWANSEFLHAEIFDGRRTKTLLTDGQMVYIWYQGEEKVIALNRDFSAATDELLALPTYEHLLMLETEQVTDAAFLVLEDPVVQCVFVSHQDALQRTKRYWIDVETGLLYKADVLENSKQVYAVTQEGYELLAPADEILQDRFLLPDGTSPFTEAEKTRQP